MQKMIASRKDWLAAYKIVLFMRSNYRHLNLTIFESTEEQVEELKKV